MNDQNTAARRAFVRGLHAEGADLAAKRKAAIRYLGAKWVLHPDYKAPQKPAPRGYSSR